MLKNKSVISTIHSPEFVNIQPTDISPLLSSCDVKVLYVGQNRNHSVIDKETATKISKTLRGNPIVGYYKDTKEDFSDHGEVITIDHDGVQFECMTRPYGFIATDAKVWFQTFEDTDKNGNVVSREYLMTQGYLWTGQYEECRNVATSGKPQSMELDDSSVSGYWTIDDKSGMDFFIINDAVISKICILGDDVEPCFEGASITSPDISTSFTCQVNDDFTNKLQKDTQVLHNFALQLQGGKKMENNTTVETPVVSAASETNAAPSNVSATFVKDKEDEKEKPKSNTEGSGSQQEQDSKDSNNSGGSEGNSNSQSNKDEEDKEKDKKKYELLQTEFTKLKSDYKDLMAKYEELNKFKLNVEDKQKDELIASFTMLDDSDKQDVKANKAKYTLDEIEAKLSVICFRKKVNFNLNDLSKNEENTEQKSMITTFSLDGANSEHNGAPEWLKAVDSHKNRI